MSKDTLPPQRKVIFLFSAHSLRGRLISWLPVGAFHTHLLPTGWGPTGQLNLKTNRIAATERIGSVPRKRRFS